MRVVSLNSQIKKFIEKWFLSNSSDINYQLEVKVLIYSWNLDFQYHSTTFASRKYKDSFQEKSTYNTREPYLGKNKWSVTLNTS